MPELDIIIDTLTGAILVEGPERVPSGIIDHLRDAFGPGREVACAAPRAMRSFPAASAEEAASEPCVRIAGYYHDSLIDGPGRRSTAKLQGCPIRCRGCVTPDSWDMTAGTLVSVNRLAQALLDPAYERDGISIVGGEPFAQADALWALIQALRARGCRHILVYSGYTYERLRRLAEHQPTVDGILKHVDLLIDGPYVQARAQGAGPWTGSTNQRLIDLAATGRTGRVTLVDPRRDHLITAAERP
jgi:anaerobic ribonucleoside-triphosphate reductase activating protein